MANSITNHLLQDAILYANEQAEKVFEKRPKFSQIMQMIQRQNRLIPTEEMERVQLAPTRPQHMVMNTAKTFTILDTEKEITFTGERSGDQTTALTWLKRKFQIIQSTKLHAMSALSKEKYLGLNLFNAEQSFWLTHANSIDAALLSYFDTNRTKVNACSDVNKNSMATWNDTTYSMDLAYTDRDYYYSAIETEMMLNNYNLYLYDIANTAWRNDFNRVRAQGTQNATNTAYQFGNFTENINVLFSNSIIPTSDEHSTHYVIPDNSFAMITFNEKINREGEDIGIEKWGTYPSMFMPGISFDLFIKKGAAHSNSDGGGYQDLVENMEFFLQFAFVKQELSVTDETPFFKYRILKSA